MIMQPPKEIVISHCFPVKTRLASFYSLALIVILDHTRPGNDPYVVGGWGRGAINHIA